MEYTDTPDPKIAYRTSDSRFGCKQTAETTEHKQQPGLASRDQRVSVNSAHASHLDAVAWLEITMSRLLPTERHHFDLSTTAASQRKPKRDPGRKIHGERKRRSMIRSA
ncbi:hypothetical protein ACRALDRAFT_208985 [Sodiomyces alcalophilus JCM 7366]|uniref:uncharacterized protein n=1 Tax=Sodiomyces alcalophilus JCM 7366 TaxID=591952 RepID=UPI0039B62E54